MKQIHDLKFKWLLDCIMTSPKSAILQSKISEEMYSVNLLHMNANHLQIPLFGRSFYHGTKDPQ